MKDGTKEHRAQLQLERIVFFSDAVFAIAITLLTLEIKIPDLHITGTSIDTSLISYLLSHMLPKFIGFIVSFMVIGIYWMVHHRMFGYVIRYNRKLLRINLIFLLSVVLMPFSSAFLSDYFLEQSHVPLAFYTVNICFTGFMTFRLWDIIGNPKYQLSEGAGNKIIMRYNMIRAFTVPFIFVLVFLLSFINQTIAWYLLPLLPLVGYFITKYYKRKYPELMKAHVLHME